MRRSFLSLVLAGLWAGKNNYKKPGLKERPGFCIDIKICVNGSKVAITLELSQFIRLCVYEAFL